MACQSTTADEISKEKADYSETTARVSSMSSRRWNYFVTIQITDKQTIKNLVAEQRDILSRYPHYLDFTIPPNSFHLTLTVLKLDTETDVQACIEAMDKAKTELHNLAKRAGSLTLQGLDSFTTKVIFAKVKFSNDFLVLVDVIRKIIKTAGIKFDQSGLTPHLTLFKVDKSAYWDRRWYKGPMVLASYFDLDPHFGVQAINNIQVCKMGTLPREKGATDFYKSIYNLEIH